MRRTNLLLPDELYNLIKERADQTGLPVNEIIRSVLIAHFMPTE